MKPGSKQPSPTSPSGWSPLSRIAGEGAERREAGEGDAAYDLGIG
jgi:hypothetical protein